MVIDEMLKDYESRFESNRASPLGMQRDGLIRMALRGIKQGLLDLERQGLKFDIGEVAKAPVVEFPKMMYHDQEQPRTVPNEQEENKLLGEGWRDTPLPEPQPVREEEHSLGLEHEEEHAL